MVLKLKGKHYRQEVKKILIKIYESVLNHKESHLKIIIFLTDNWGDVCNDFVEYDEREKIVKKKSILQGARRKKLR